MSTLILILFISSGVASQTLDEHIVAASAEYGLQPDALRSIASVESQNGKYRLNARTLDYGAFQVNYKTASSYGWDTSRLYADDAYGAKAAGRVLHDLKKRFKAKEGRAYICRFHVGTGKLVGKRAEACHKYLLKLEQAGYILPVVALEGK